MLTNALAPVPGSLVEWRSERFALGEMLKSWMADAPSWKFVPIEGRSTYRSQYGIDRGERRDVPGLE